MSEINTWYVVGRVDEQCCFNYSQVTPKGQWYNTFEEADKARSKLKDLWAGTELVIMKRTCEVLNG